MSKYKSMSRPSLYLLLFHRHFENEAATILLTSAHVHSLSTRDYIVGTSAASKFFKSRAFHRALVDVY